MKTNMIQHLTETTFAILTDDIEINESDVTFMIDDDIIEHTFFDCEDSGTASVYGYKRAFVYEIRSKNEMIARKNEIGNYDILDNEGFSVTTIDANVYPVDSYLSARYEHSNGIELTLEDVTKLNIKID